MILATSVLHRFRRPLQATGLLGVLFVLSVFMPPVRLFADARDYLPLHSGLEIFSLVVAGMVFALGWNLRRSARGARLVWLGAACLAVGLLDFAHLMSFPGMPPFFTPNSADKAIAFWLMARLLGVLGLLAHAVLPERDGGGPAAAWAVLAAIGVAFGWSWLVLAHPQVLPATFIEGQGVTPLKSVLEGGLVLLHLAAAILLARRALADGESAAGWLAAAAATMALAELHFARYAAVADLYNVLGHAYKVAAFAMIYRAVFVSGVRAPQRALAAERALLRGLIDSVPDLIAFRDREGRYLGCNKAFAEAYGIREAALVGRSDGEVFAGRLPLAGAGQDTVSCAENHEEWLEAADGTLRLLDTLRTPYFDLDGVQLGEIRVSRDFTERRRVREQIAERERRLMLALEGAELGLWDWDVPSGRANFSPMWCRMLGYAADELPANVSSWESLVHPDDWYDIRDSLEPHLRGTKDAYRAEYRLKHKSGHWVWVLAAGRVLDRGEGGEALRMVGIHQDISQRKAMEESLLQLATSDPLTGLWNRRHFVEVVRGELGRVRRNQAPAALLLMDLDFFKRINDTHGHAAGDEVLRHFTATVSAQLREADVFARLGGEEFAVLLPSIDALGAVRAADRLRR
ncbi:MAG TPA: MASE3 domain-containing protein, partial [Thauera aminoaromatica]|nr:MASE3 domain-containing protein [Thauera aminoaromatica]